MSTINYTYNVIVDRFRQFAAGHFQLRRFTHGEISQADLEKEAEWPWLHVKPRAINYSPGTRSFSFEIFISDLPRDKEDKTGYQAESITDCSLIFQDLINEIYLGNMFGSDVVLTRPVNAEPFVEQYTHTLTGVTGTIELNLDYDWSACSIPASWNYNTPTDSGTDGWGALQFIESLDQNGAFVSLLNDVEAPGNSYYYGTNASGVKGWYAIVDNIGLTCETLPDCATIISIVDDIAALESGKVDKVAGKGLSTEDYTTAEKSKLAGIQAGAEVNVNADWNAVSGDAQILNKPTIPSIAGLVPETRTLTINGTTQDLSADRTFSVGTFNLPSLTSGSVLFSNGTTIAQDNANLFWDDTNNRLGIGTATPATTLQIAGTATITPAALTGSAATSALDIAQTWNTTGTPTAIKLNITDTASNGNSRLLDIQLNGASRFIFVKNGNLFFGAFNNSSNIQGDDATRGLILRTSMTTTAGSGFLFSNLQGNIANLLGTANGLTIQPAGSLGFNPTSGTGLYNSIHINDKINQTGGANGITRGLYINPTLTSAADWRAIETTNGKVIFGGTGNVLIGTTTDAGFKLDVNGTARFSDTLSFTNTSSLSPQGTTAADRRLLIRGGEGGAVGSTSLITLTTNGNITSTSGNPVLVNISRDFAPTSGTATYALASITGTINQTGGANGITRGLYINPTLTSAADFRAIETTRGRIVFGNLPTSSAGLPTGAIWNDAGTLKIV